MLNRDEIENEYLNTNPLSFLKLIFIITITSLWDKIKVKL